MTARPDRTFIYDPPPNLSWPNPVSPSLQFAEVFTVEPGSFLLYTVSTCGTGIQNQIAANPTNGACSRKMIYDYTDWAGVGNYLAWNCQAAQRARGGICMANSGIFTNVPDFFIQ